MKFTQIPADTFRELHMTAGILLDTFTPATGVIGKILGATSGGNTFEATAEFSDLGDDIDNCPKNMKELKKLESWEAKLSGTFSTVSASLAKMLVGAADADTSDATHIVPRNELTDKDFTDVWWVGDYSNLNGDKNGGFCAIHLMNAINTGGFKIKSSDKAKGQFDFEFTGHYSMDKPDTVPFEIYVKAGTAEASESSAKSR